MSRTERHRTLIHIPIVHSQGDMGSLGRRLPRDQAYGLRARARWAEIDRLVRALQIGWPGARVYQDGLPDAGPEVVQKILAEVHSPNYALLRWLVAQGAELVGTESPSLLKEEYERLQAVLTAKDRAAGEQAHHAYAARAAPLLAERDAYIARRIVETLPLDGIGLLFIGEAHRVVEHLPGDIVVQRLSERQATPAPG